VYSKIRISILCVLVLCTQVNIFVQKGRIHSYRRN
jgi:hypothetical protein